MKEIPLKELTEEIAPGFACRPKNESNVLQLRPYSITSEGKLDLSQSKYVDCDTIQYKKYKLKKGDILFNNTNSPELVGKTTFINEDIDAVFSNHLTRISVKSNLIDSVYLSKYLHSLFLRKVFFNRCQQWVNQAAIQKTELEKYKIPVPTLPTQKKIAEILTKAESALQKRRETIKLLDEYLKSVFLEMFGDYPKEKITNFVQDTNQENPSISRKGKKFKYIDIASINNKEGTIVSFQELLGEEAPSRAKKVIKFGDIIVSTVRPNLNATAFINPEFDNEICSTGFSVLHCNDKLNNKYLYVCTRMNFFIDQLVEKTKGASYPAVNHQDVLNVKIPNAPITDQQKFASIVKKIESLKQKMKESEKELDVLFKALMQRSFRGS